MFCLCLSLSLSVSVSLCLSLCLSVSSVPTRHIQSVEDPLFNLESKSDGTRTPSVSSMRSSRTGGSKSTTSLSSRALSRNGTNRGDHHLDNPPKIIELDENNSLSEGSAGMNSTHHLYDLLQKQVCTSSLLTPCLTLCLSVCLYLCVSVSICLSVCLSLSLSLSVSLSLCLSLCLSLSPSPSL
jgi:hypothetical protein